MTSYKYRKGLKIGVENSEIFDKPVLLNTVPPLLPPNQIQSMESCDIINENVFVYIGEFLYGGNVSLP